MNMNKMSQWVNISIGAFLILIGAVILILSFSTKLFYTKIKNQPSAGTTLIDPETLLLNAACTWDETSIVLNASGAFVKWASTKQYRDADANPLYTYDLLPSTGTVDVCRSNKNTTSIRLNGTAYLTNQRTSTQTWSSFPRYESDETVIVVSSCPSQASSAPNGMSVWHYSDDADISVVGRNFDLSVDFSTASSLLNGSGVINPVVLAKDATTQTTGNVVVYPSTNTFYNGTSSSLETTAGSFIAPKINANQPKLEIGRYLVKRFINQTYSGTIHAIYVFGRKLSSDEISAVSVYLKHKYLGPYLRYPTEISAAINSQITIENTLVPGATPIELYQISPSLPAGLTFSTSTGAITRTPTAEAPVTKFQIHATNAFDELDYVLTLQVMDSQTSTVPPNISFATTSITARLNESIVSPTPINTGGAVVSYSITPQISSGMLFDTLTGILTGSASENVNTQYTVTAQNDAGISSAKFRLQVGISILYSSDISGTVDTAIETLTPTVSGTSDTRLEYSYTGDLYGLTFDKSTGSISGTPTSFGTNRITVSLNTTSTSAVSTRIAISINKAGSQTEFKDKVYYMSAGGVAVGVGAAILGVSWWNSKASSG